MAVAGRADRAPRLIAAISCLLAATVAARAGDTSAPEAQAGEVSSPPPAAPPEAAASRSAPAIGFGMAVAEGAGPAGIAEGLRSPTPRTPCYLLVPAGRSELTAPGQLDPLFEEAERRGLRLIVRLVETGWTEPGSSEPFPADEWIARITAFVARAGGRVFAYQILDAPAALHDARSYAYLLKRAAVAIRGQRPGTPIVSGSIGSADAAWAEVLLAADTTPYVDVLAARDAASLGTVADLRDRLHPPASLWVVDVDVDPRSAPAAATHACFQSLQGGARVVLLGASSASLPGLGELLARLRTMLEAGMSPASSAALPFDPAASPVALETIAFFEPERREGLAIYRAPSPGPTEAVRFALKAPVEWLDLLDPRTDLARRIGTRIPPGSVIEVPVRSDDLVLSFRLMAEAIPVQESLRVGATTALTAEEIIAREREFRAAQAGRLRHYEARASINIHYRIASLDTSVDVLTENRLYVHDGKQDYEETALYVDGAKWRGKQRPSLPFIQPDKIKEIPLDIVLDENYRYALAGREKVDRRDCYVLSITPVTADRSLYQGRVYIDSAIFARVRMDVVQTALKEPLRQNSVTYRFGPIEVAGQTFWLPIEVRGQMVFELLGQNLVVERQAAYSDFSINQEGFGERVATAYASDNPIFRDTNEGYFRVDRSGPEERLESVSTPRNVFLVMGANIGFKGSPGLPFAGVNFFDFDFHGSGNQVDIAWAGPFADISWTDPTLTHPEPGRRPLALTFRGSLNAIPRRDKNATISGTDNAENVNIYSETALADLGIPMGHFVKWTIEARATYMDFKRLHDETSDAFVLPPTSIEEALRLRLEVNRAGYIISPWVEGARRTRWEPWGLPGTPFDPHDRDYTRRGMDLQKSFYYGLLRKIVFSLALYDGASLDRFSRYELGDFRTARVRGFNGSGIHFDRGAVFSTAYAFNVGQSLRIDTGLEAGWIQNADDFGPGYQRVIGGGLGVEFSGPWSTLVNARVGRGFSSTIFGKGGGGDIRVVFYRTFDRWSRRPPR